MNTLYCLKLFKTKNNINAWYPYASIFFHKTEEFKVKRFSFYCSILNSPHENPMKPKVIIINIFICILSEFSNRKNITMYIFISIQTALKVAFFPLINLGLQHIQIYYHIRIVYYFLLFHNLYN